MPPAVRLERSLILHRGRCCRTLRVRLLDVVERGDASVTPETNCCDSLNEPLIFSWLWHISDFDVNPAVAASDANRCIWNP